ncbi:MAG: Dam family site-specific DNA-(adenine-N6)-methyltransferase [Alistipes sp.]|nr:Dam family site-specific DNA-(adenine-N6)-methyltransferase [Alistipes sp.]MDE7129654.1 Dam family site-specific DNA-(adenine-N6)-methyltransferase [Alistipes sp.]
MNRRTKIFADNTGTPIVPIKSPMNYIGGKFRILPQLLPLFPERMNRFVDLFAGGCNVGINVGGADTVICNDNICYLIDLYNEFRNNRPEQILSYIEQTIRRYELSRSNRDGYLALRETYNTIRQPLDLFILVAYAFNHQIRYNGQHKFTTPFGKDRSSYNTSMQSNLVAFLDKIHSAAIEFSCYDFEAFDFEALDCDDFVYCDPPYLITTGSYNDGKRGFKGWSMREETALLDILERLDRRGIRFALSNVLTHKGKRNTILEQWIDNHGFVIHPIASSYANSSYHTTDRTPHASMEIVVTNYTKDEIHRQ